MTTATGWPQRRFRRAAWLLGVLVLLAAAAAVAAALGRGRPAPPRSPAVPQFAGESTTPLPPNPDSMRLRQVAIGGVVALPDGSPAAGATVVLYRALSAWPEWQRESLDQAITGADGRFQFAAAAAEALLLGYAHPRFAGGLEEVPFLGAAVRLQLQPGFALSGVVTTAAGLPLANAQVVAEPVQADQRRAEVATTGPDGRYSMLNLAAGPVRLLARHANWQPAIAAAVPVGAVSRFDLVLARPTPIVLRGRVVAASSQQAVAAATVELLPPNGKLGLAEPLRTVTDPDGNFQLGGLAPGAGLLLVRHPEFGALQRPLAVRATAGEQLLELPARVALRGRLVAPGPLPLPLVNLRLRARDAAGELVSTAVDADGRFEFAQRLSPGSAQLTLWGSAYAFERSRTQALSLRLEEPAPAEVVLPLLPAGLLRGSFRDAAGQPLAGVQVWRTRQLATNARWLGDAAAALDLTAFGSQVAQLVGGDRDELLAVSGPDGRFEIVGQAPGPLLLRCEAHGYATRWQRSQAPEPGQRELLPQLTMVPGGGLRGRVMRGGLPLAGASVVAIGSEGQLAAVTAGDGSYAIRDLAAGRHRVRARLASMPSASAESEVVVQPGVAELTIPPLRLPAGRVLRGSVLGSDGQPVAGALIAIRGQFGQPTISDGNGQFAIELPPRGNVELQVTLADRRLRTSVPVGRDETEVEVRLELPPASALVAQVALLPGRKRPGGALLRLQPLGERQLPPQVRWLDLSGGELRWPLVPVGRVRVEIQCEGHVPWVGERDFQANEELSLGEILLEPGCWLTGKVVDAAGAPVANAAVWLGEEADLELFEPQTRTATDGSFQVHGVSTRSARLVVRAPGLATWSGNLALPGDVLASEPFVVQLQSGATIEVLSTQRRAGALLQLQQDGRLLAVAEVDEQGRAAFSHCSPGRYSLQWFDDDDAPLQLELTAGQQRLLIRM